MNPEYITLDDWEQRYGKVRRTYYNWKSKYDFPAVVRIGRKRYLRLKEVEAFESRFSNHFESRAA
jgi:predicted DNA-binding transcriptional regulator AlpA